MPHVLGEGLVQPQVVPPAHGDQITEPHVGHLVRDDPCSRRSVGTGRATAVDERVAERDAAGIFHSAGVEVRHESLVVLAEWVPARKRPVVVVKALLGHREHVLRLTRQAARRAISAAWSPSRIPSCSSSTEAYGPATSVTK